MKKIIATVASLLALSMLFVSCGGGAEEEGEYEEIVAFDPEATDTYKVYNKYAEGEFTGELVLDTDYTIENGMLAITPNEWDGAWIVLNDEVDGTGIKKSYAYLASDGASTIKMGLNTMADDPDNTGKVGSSNYVADSSSKATKIESKFGKAFTGTLWSNGSSVSYEGKESIKFLQAYGQDTSDWSATTTTKIYVGKVVLLKAKVQTEVPEFPEVTIPDGALDLSPFTGWTWGWDSDYDSETKTVTLTAADGALSNGANPATDWSAYESMTVVIYDMSEAYVKLCIAGDGWNTSCETKYEEAISKTATEITLDFGTLDSTAVSQWMIQGSSSGETITVLAAYLNPKTAD